MKQFGNLMKQAQQMQARLVKLQEEAGSLTAEAGAGGGMVRAVANGRGELVSLAIEKDVVDPADIAMLEDLVTAAVNEVTCFIPAGTIIRQGPHLGGQQSKGGRRGRGQGLLAETRPRPPWQQTSASGQPPRFPG